MRWKNICVVKREERRPRRQKRVEEKGPRRRKPSICVDKPNESREEIKES